MLPLVVFTVTSAALGQELKPAQPVRQFVARYCLDCHSGDAAEASVNLESVDLESLRREDRQAADTWERVVRKLRSRQMPPDGADRPSAEEYADVLQALIGRLDADAQENPRPGRTASLRRMTRVEYQNAIRDLLDVHIDAKRLLPADSSSHGFDNITVDELSPTLLNRYVSAAQHIARLALGGSAGSPDGATYRVPADRTQERHVTGLPLGTRGGLLVEHTFPADGEYELQVRLARDRNEEVEGLRGEHTVIFLIDRREVARHTVRPPKDRNFSLVDVHLNPRVRVTAGRHHVGVTFLRKSASLIETRRQPYDARFNMHRHPRTAPAVFQVSITGPYERAEPGPTASRERVFGQTSVDDGKVDDGKEEQAAKQIVTRLMRLAFRRPVKPEEVAAVMGQFRQVWSDSEDPQQRRQRFESALRLAITAILVSPRFLFRIERDPADTPPGSVYQVSDLELASRLSFFLWSSIPDEPLLRDAERGKLSDPEVLEAHVRRMLTDPRSSSLTTNFAGQWLHLRNLKSFTPDLRKFPDFDDNLRESFRRETELFFDSVHREDRSVLDLLSADYTFLNERLARHYGIPHIRGSRFRRVSLTPEMHRGGLLRHGSVLTVTSYATRTSPVIRGYWILQNLLAAPPPPPPANVPALKDNTVDSSLSVRARLREHRANPACASCHQLMDPIGLSLENFDAVGRWRTTELGRPVDATGGLPGFEQFAGVDGLERALLQRPDLFVSALAEKLLTYALGRVPAAADGPALRQIVRTAEADSYRFSTLVLAVVKSTPFRFRETRSE